MSRLQPALAVGAIVTLLATGCGESGKLGAKALAQQADSLQSEAAEGALLAEDAAAGRSTRIYTRVHSSTLAKAAAGAEASLRAATTVPALEPELHRLVGLAARINDRLDRLDDASKTEQRALARQLQRAAEQSKQISEGLS